MKVSHWTDNEDLIDGIKALPDAIDTANEGLGLFVYPLKNEVEWENRIRTVWEIPRKYLREVQRFRRGELGMVDGIPQPPHLVIELFVKAQFFQHLTRVE